MRRGSDLQPGASGASQRPAVPKAASRISVPCGAALQLTAAFEVGTAADSGLATREIPMIAAPGLQDDHMTEHIAAPLAIIYVSSKSDRMLPFQQRSQFHVDGYTSVLAASRSGCWRCFADRGGSKHHHIEACPDPREGAYCDPDRIGPDEALPAPRWRGSRRASSLPSGLSGHQPAAGNDLCDADPPSSRSELPNVGAYGGRYGYAVPLPPLRGGGRVLVILHRPIREVGHCRAEMESRPLLIPLEPSLSVGCVGRCDLRSGLLFRAAGMPITRLDPVSIGAAKIAQKGS